MREWTVEAIPLSFLGTWSLEMVKLGGSDDFRGSC